MKKFWKDYKTFSFSRFCLFFKEGKNVKTNCILHSRRDSRPFEPSSLFRILEIRFDLSFFQALVFVSELKIVSHFRSHNASGIFIFLFFYFIFHPTRFFPTSFPLLFLSCCLAILSLLSLYSLYSLLLYLFFPTVLPLLSHLLLLSYHLFVSPLPSLLSPSLPLSLYYLFSPTFITAVSFVSFYLSTISISILSMLSTLYSTVLYSLYPSTTIYLLSPLRSSLLSIFYPIYWYPILSMVVACMYVYIYKRTLPIYVGRVYIGRVYR